MEEQTMILAPQKLAMPIMTLDIALERRSELVEFVKKIMVEGKDFGAIPGTGDKPTLLKPGAEKLTTFFGLTPQFVDETVIEDFVDPDYPFFFYRRKCQLWKGNMMVAEASGSCNSREKKYRWRTANRVCPTCGKEAIIKGKAEYGGGFVCWNKKGGCGAKFPDNAPEIVNQLEGQVENPDIYDLGNTILKMADKRALVATTLLAVNASEFFTQDLEDMIIEGAFIEPESPKPDKKPRKARSNNRSKWQSFLADAGLTEKEALAALGHDSVVAWLKANPGKSDRNAYDEILAVMGKA